MKPGFNSSSRARVRITFSQLRRFLCRGLWIVFALPVWVGATEPVLDLKTEAEGAPFEVSQRLPEASYIPIEMKRLKNARVVWVNFDYLREKGYRVPEEGLTPEFEKQLLDLWAYTIPSDRESAGRVGVDSKTFYVDRYGGENGSTGGSGRAAVRGRFQLKGIGRTPIAQAYSKSEIKKSPFRRFVVPGFVMGEVALFAEVFGWVLNAPGLGFWGGAGAFGTMAALATPRLVSSYAHSHGGSSLFGAIIEAVWGEVLNRETPNGANRIVAVISTGTSTNWGLYRDPRAIVVREDPLRPAHFLSTPVESPASEAERVAALMAPLKEEFQAQGYLTWGAALKGFAKNLGRQYGAMMALSTFHGATSPSNIQINGGSLDHGTMTAIDGYTPVQFNYDNTFRTTAETLIIKPLVQSVRDMLQKTGDSSQKVPRNIDLYILFGKSLQGELQRQFLRLTGTPDEILKQALRWDESKAFLSELQVISELSQGLARDVRFSIPKSRSPFDIQEILVRLASGAPLREPALQKLERLYHPFKDRLQKVAKAHGLSDQALSEYMRLAARVRGEKRRELMRGPKQWMAAYLKIFAMHSKKDPRPVAQHINQLIDQSARDYGFQRTPYTVVLNEVSFPEQGFRLRRQFEAKANRTRVILIDTTGRGRKAEAFVGGRLVGEFSELDLQQAELKVQSDCSAILTALKPAS